MFSLSDPSPGWRAAGVFAGGVLFVFVYVVDIAFLGRNPFLDRVPGCGPVFLTRSLLLAASALVLSLALRRRGTPNAGSGRGLDWLMQAAVLGLAALTALFIVSPYRFYLLSREDGPIESLTALLFFAASTLFVARAFRRGGSWYFAGLAIVAFVVGMEEVSWLQRQLGFQTPAMFGGNLQGEATLHNFATNQVEIFSYFAAALFFLVDGSIVRTSTLPGRHSAMAAAMFCALNYDMWDMPSTQLTLYLAAIILWRMRRATVLATETLILCIVTQGVLLEFGGQLASFRLSTVTESKELFISVACFVYSCEANWARTRVQP